MLLQVLHCMSGPFGRGRVAEESRSVPFWLERSSEYPHGYARTICPTCQSEVMVCGNSPENVRQHTILQRVRRCSLCGVIAILGCIGLGVVQITGTPSILLLLLMLVSAAAIVIAVVVAVVSVFLVYPSFQVSQPAERGKGSHTVHIVSR